MRIREPQMPLDPDVERELAAIDAGVTGKEVEPGLEELAELGREMRGLRDAPEPDFAAELDASAAEGFPREGRLASIRGRLIAIRPHRVLVPAGAVATLLVAVGVWISQIGGDREGGGPDGISSQPRTAGGAATASPGAEGDHANAPRGHTVPAPTLGSPQATDRIQRALRGSTPTLGGPAGGLLPNRNARKVESNAQLTLGADSDQVPDVADSVVDVTHGYDGIVVSSQVTQDDSGARASFDLAIPSARLQAALADLSDLAHVQSSSEGSLDITAPTVAVHRRIAHLAGRLADLRGRLAAAVARGDTSAQQVIEQKIQYVHSVLKRARNRSAELARRAAYSRVAVSVTSNGVAVAGGAGWTLDDAVRDAGKVLTVTAGVLLVTAAVLGPLALLGALAWSTVRTLLRSRRERSLDSAAES